MGSPFGDGGCLLLTLHTEPLRSSIVFNANRPHARPAGGKIRSVPASTASWCSSRRSNDGQTILRAISPAFGKPLNCTYGRDGRIRTGGPPAPKAS